VNTGKACLVFRDFPLSIRDTSIPGRRRAGGVCGGSADRKYGAGSDALFRSQQT